MSNRRIFLQHALGLGAGLLAFQRLFGANQIAPPSPQSSDLSKRERRNHPGPAYPGPAFSGQAFNTPSSRPTSVIFRTPWGSTKIFRLTAQVVRQQIAPNKTIDAWGFNGSAPGPTIQVTNGDRVQVIFENQLSEPSSIHWHGFEDLIGYDGMPGISQKTVRPGEEFCRFTRTRN
jgi:FtsP/CotA-like multicopper oxidase with cupredoxin domain